VPPQDPDQSARHKLQGTTQRVRHSTRQLVIHAHTLLRHPGSHPRRVVHVHGGDDQLHLDHGEVMSQAHAPAGAEGPEVRAHGRQLRGVVRQPPLGVKEVRVREDRFHTMQAIRLASYRGPGRDDLARNDGARGRHDAEERHGHRGAPAHGLVDHGVQVGELVQHGDGSGLRRGVEGVLDAGEFFEEKVLDVCVLRRRDAPHQYAHGVAGRVDARNQVIHALGRDGGLVVWDLAEEFGACREGVFGGLVAMERRDAILPVVVQPAASDVICRALAAELAHDGCQLRFEPHHPAEVVQHVQTCAVLDAGKIVDEPSVLRVRDSLGAVNTVEMIRDGAELGQTRSSHG
jgi:hypothetical protein